MRKTLPTAPEKVKKEDAQMTYQRKSGPTLRVTSREYPVYPRMCPDCPKGSGRTADDKRCKTCKGRGRVTEELIRERARIAYEERQADLKFVTDAIEAAFQIEPTSTDWGKHVYWVTAPGGRKFHIEVGH